MQLVLIVEDDVLFRAAMSRAVGKLPSIEVIEAGGVAEAWQLIRGLPVDLMIADIELRDGTVLEILPQLEDRRIPAVLVSGHVDEFAERLPSGLEVYAKPVTPSMLCELVTARLGCPDVRSPFSLADYMQLAAMGQHSVALDASVGGEPVGTVVIARGEAWSAHDDAGDGVDAFLRMISRPDVGVGCTAAPANLGPRNLTGSIEHLLIDATRVLDEIRAAPRPRTTTLRPPATPLRAPRPPSLPPAVPAIPSPPPDGTPVTRRDARVAEPNGESERARPGDAAGEFDRLYALGIEALLARRYHDAYDTLQRASQIRTTPSLTANLNRLREMGFK